VLSNFDWLSLTPPLVAFSGPSETIPDLNSNRTKSMTHHNQTKELTTWFLNLLDESIDNKSTKFEV
jgi:hypothetical protein